MKKLSELISFLTFDWYRKGPTEDKLSKILSIPDCDSLKIGDKIFSNKYY